PTSDIDTITRRQNIITALRTRPHLTSKLRKLLVKLGKEQHHQIGLTDDNHPIYDKGLSPFFLKRPVRQLASLIEGKSFSNPDTKKGTDRFIKVLDDVWKIGGPITFIGGVAKLIANRHKLRDRSVIMEIGGPGFWYGGGGFEVPISVKGILPKKLRPYAGIIIALASAWLLWQAKNIGWSIRDRLRVFNYLHSQLLPLKALFKSMRSCRQLARMLPELQDLADEIDFKTTTKNKELDELHAIIHGPAFRQTRNTKRDFLLRHLAGGDVIHAIPLLRRARTDLFKGCALIGALDAYLSIATLLNEHQDGVQTYSMARFMNRSTPYLSLQNLWHPSVKDSVLNNLTLGGSGMPQNAVITGLFESGKSTLLQAVTINVLLAQTLGIAAAQDMVLTPFASINMYANIKDDIASGRSLFKTELYRAVQLLEYIKQLPMGAFSFTAGDSTFTGTEAGAGQAAAYAVAKYLGTLPNSIGLHATNFLSMSELGAEDPETFATYYLPTTFDGNSAGHTYELQPGSEKPHQSLAIFYEENFPADMIARMEAVLAHPQDYPTAAQGMNT
ncbi:MAG: hypothetical protein PVJ92_02815, partial [Candidatus Dependentiae bacterium]